jgi:hypothetical protein
MLDELNKLKHLTPQEFDARLGALLKAALEQQFGELRKQKPPKAAKKKRGE